MVEVTKCQVLELKFTINPMLKRSTNINLPIGKID